MMDLVTATAEESARFAVAASRVGELADPASSMVPSCPDWSIDDLVWHLTGVQHFWASIVADGLNDPRAVQPLTRTPDFAAQVRTFGKTSARLVSALADADPERPCWTWYQPDQRVGWVRRRQANEALIHRVDAELALGAVGGDGVGSIGAELAADGVDEMLRVMLGVDPIPAGDTWYPDGTEVELVATVDGGPDRSWLVQFGRLTRTGGGAGGAGQGRDDAALRVVETGIGAVPDATVRGPAAELDLWLWRRGEFDQATVDGDRDLVERLPNLSDSDSDSESESD